VHCGKNGAAKEGRADNSETVTNDIKVREVWTTTDEVRVARV
jgi:hypothetical protein